MSRGIRSQPSDAKLRDACALEQSPAFGQQPALTETKLIGKTAAMRIDGRKADELRPIRITTGYQKAAAGSVLVQWGDTWVLCAASVESRVPPFRLDSGGGWVTAEYAMLPGSTYPRKARRTGGRESEIQRLIGRALRMSIDIDRLGQHTINVDCDVLRADGGTRVASVTGGYIALCLAVDHMLRKGMIKRNPITNAVAAVSVGMVSGNCVLDLAYKEDSTADVDMNVVMNKEGALVEIQGTGERQAFSRQQLDELCTLSWTGIKQLLALQQNTIEAARQTPCTTVEL